ncbi:12510_t:CDS:2 [Funneliformis mosseae]|uniref:12510_t:CDS:1 n=1 Tax=Funneliformis mosseae TaxID=27381 RepID=A0A9N9BX79_FUNMO|nr:12510_t:CDS:2 [Funneliformis mosseae]
MVENWIEMVNTENNLNNNEALVEKTNDFEAGGDKFCLNKGFLHFMINSTKHC